MNRTLWQAHAYTTTALGLIASSAYAAIASTPLNAGPGLLAALFFTGCARRAYKQHRREQAITGQLERLTHREPPQLLDACCLLWGVSDGLIHGRNCSRPFGARRGLLDDACCEQWWTSCGTEHDSTCRTQTRSSAA